MRRRYSWDMVASRSNRSWRLDGNPTLPIHIRVDEPHFCQSRFSLCISLLGLVQNPKVIHLFAFPNDIMIQVAPLCVNLQDAVSDAELIGFLEQPQLIELLPL